MSTGSLLEPLTFELGEAPALPIEGKGRGAFEVETIDERLEPLRIEVGALQIPSDLKDVRGAWLGRPLGEPGYVMHDVKGAVFVLGEEWILAQTSTGLWLHEGRTLARRARVARPPIDALTASRDGSRFAFASGQRLTVAEFPSLRTVASATIPRPHRIRMSPSGGSVAVASQRDEAVALIDVGSNKIWRFEVNDEVNDAIPLDGHPGEVAYADDSDDVFVRRMTDGAVLFSSLHAKPPGYPTRDMNGVAYDPESDTLFGGSEDNAVWKYEGWRDTVRWSRSDDYPGDVDVIVFQPKVGGGRIIAGLDSQAVVVESPRGARLGPFGDRIFSDPIDVSLGKEGTILTAMNGRLGRWNPSQDAALFARDTHRSTPFFAVGRVAMFGSFDSMQAFFVRRSSAIHAAVTPLQARGVVAQLVTLGEADFALVVGETATLVRVNATEVREAPLAIAEGYKASAPCADKKCIGILSKTGVIYEVGADTVLREVQRAGSMPPTPYLHPGPSGWTVTNTPIAPR